MPPSCALYLILAHQHDFNATQVPPEWHAWLSHIRKDPPQEDPVVQNLSPPWKAVCVNYSYHPLLYSSFVAALDREFDRDARCLQDV